MNAYGVQNYKWCKDHGIDPQVLIDRYWERLVSMANTIDKIDKGQGYLIGLPNPEGTKRRLEQQTDDLQAVMATMIQLRDEEAEDAELV